MTMARHFKAGDQWKLMEVEWGLQSKPPHQEKLR